MRSQAAEKRRTPARYDRGMLERVIGGGQTGVDQAALRAAAGVIIPTDGQGREGAERKSRRVIGRRDCHSIMVG